MSYLSCIIPSAWNYYPEFLVRLIVHSHLIEHWEQHHTVIGSVIMLGDVTAISQLYILNIIWFKKIEDLSDDPFTEEYTILSMW